MPRILVVDDETAVRRVVVRLLQRMRFDIVEAVDGLDAAEKLKDGRYDLVVTDLRMPRADGFSVLNAVRDQGLSTPAIMLTGDGSVADCVTAMKAGAFNFLNKPFNNGEFERIVRDALGSVPPPPSDSQPIPESQERSQVALIGHSARLHEVLDTVQRLANSDTTVLLTGETGTGKEVVSRLLHGVSSRAIKPFVTINCAAIGTGAGEAELFGGGPYDPSKTTTGRLLAADGGTLFLDEVGDLSMSLQGKLLRVVQDRQIITTGDVNPRPVDIRVIAATHCDLEDMVRKGTFREDLYYRLNVITIELPPLRERAEDVPVLFNYFLDAASRASGKTLRMEEDAMAALTAYSWPGNVRELQNLAERMVVLDRTGVITLQDLPKKILGGGTPSSVGHPTPSTLATGPTLMQSAQPPPPSAPPRTSAASRSGLVEGATIQDRFRLVRKIGAGGAASVYQARDLELSADVAIKFLERQSLDDGSASRFKQEVAILRTLVHPNIVRIFEFGTYLDCKYFVMELLSGRDLGAMFRENPGPMPTAQAIDCLIQTCHALAAAHGAGITHRDIKPENLFITTEGVVKVMDFGIAKREKAPGVTHTGWLAGTPEYIAPEQIAGFSHVTHLADIYSLGCVAYRMFTGRPPFTHAELYPLLIMHSSAVPDPIRPQNPSISPELESLVLRLLAKTPKERVQSCGELATQLAALRG